MILRVLIQSKQSLKYQGHNHICCQINTIEIRRLNICYLLFKVSNSLIKPTMTSNTQKEKWQSEFINVQVRRWPRSHHICLCNSENNMSLVTRIFRDGKFPIHETSSIYLHGSVLLRAMMWNPLIRVWWR